MNSYACGKLSSEGQPGDQMTLTCFCRDENGLGYGFFLKGWIAVGERDAVSWNPEWMEWPKLTWD